MNGNRCAPAVAWRVIRAGLWALTRGGAAARDAAAQGYPTFGRYVRAAVGTGRRR